MLVHKNQRNSNMYIDMQNKISKLKDMLLLNKSAQVKLNKLKQGINKRKEELEQIGFITKDKQTINEIFDKQSPLNIVRKVPPELQDQINLKKSPAQQYGFIKNIIQDKSIKIMNEEKANKKKKKVEKKSSEKQIEQLGSNPRAIDFVKMSEKFQKTSIELFKQWRKIFRAQNKKIVSINDERLVEKRRIYGDSWNKISYFFNGLHFDDLYYYFHENNLSNFIPGKWTLKQNLILLSLVEYYGVGKWAVISKKLRMKSEFQIRERYCNVLDPLIRQNKWNENQCKHLIGIAKQYNYQWSKIVKNVPLFNTKTDNALRRKYRNLMIKKSDEQIEKEITTNEKLKSSILLFKKKYYNRKKVKKAQSQSEDPLAKNQEFQ